uniref:Uncharacterized protein n=1 Tax=Sphaerodactylus townsendi TaxID=933632 RepID=A0ACB8FQK5_9SAUR
MATGSFTPPREDFARSATEGTRAAKNKTADPQPNAQKATSKKKGNKQAGDKIDGAPAQKRPRQNEAAGSSAPPEGAAIAGGSTAGSSYPTWDSESPASPNTEEERRVPTEPRQSQGTQGEGAETRKGTNLQPDPAAAAVAAWQAAPPAAFARFLSDQIEKALDAREARQAASDRAASSATGAPHRTEDVVSVVISYTATFEMFHSALEEIDTSEKAGSGMVAY